MKVHTIFLYQSEKVSNSKLLKEWATLPLEKRNSLFFLEKIKSVIQGLRRGMKRIVD